MGAETRVTSRDFNREPSRIKKAADTADVIITERGRPTHVMLSYEVYQRLKGAHKPRTLYDLAMSLPELPDTPDFDDILEQIRAEGRVMDEPFEFDPADLD